MARATIKDTSLDFIWEQMEKHIVLVNGDKFELLSVSYFKDYGAYNVRFADRVTGKTSSTLLTRESVADATGKLEIDGYRMKAVPAHSSADVKSPPTEPAEVSTDQADEVRRALIELLCDVYVDGVHQCTDFPDGVDVSEYATDMADRFLHSVYEEILSDPHHEEDREGDVDDSFDPRPDDDLIPLPPWVVTTHGTTSSSPLSADVVIDLWSNAEDDS